MGNQCECVHDSNENNFRQKMIQVSSLQCESNKDQSQQLQQQPSTVHEISQKLVHVKVLEDQNLDIENLDNYIPLLVPYTVIKMTMNSLITTQLEQRFPEILKQIQSNNEEQSKQLKWRLYQSGVYARKNGEKSVLMMNQKAVYDGEVIDQAGFIPEGKGIYVTQSTIYKGNFKNGKANGEGKFQSENIFAEGTWLEGLLASGCLSNIQFKYEGQLEDGLPSVGKITYSNDQISYQGKFLYGLFEDQSATYKCSLYTYIGGFKSGRKNGLGTLQDNESKLHGQWRNDMLMQQRYNS